MAKGKALERAVSITVAAPLAANSGVGPIKDDPLLIGSTSGGKLACVAQTSYTPPGSLTPTGNISVDLEGAYFLTVTAKSSLSPSVNAAINPGDRIYADGGTLDSVTGMTYGFTLDKNSSGDYFGNALDALATGTTGTIRVRLKVAG